MSDIDTFSDIYEMLLSQEDHLIDVRKQSQDSSQDLREGERTFGTKPCHQVNLIQIAPRKASYGCIHFHTWFGHRRNPPIKHWIDRNNSGKILMMHNMRLFVYWICYIFAWVALSWIYHVATMHCTVILAWVKIWKSCAVSGSVVVHHSMRSHIGDEGILGKVGRPDQVSYLSESVSTSRFGICKSLNISLGSEWENTRFVRSNGQKTTFEWPKVVSEVSFPTFWGVFRSIKVVSVFRFGSAVSEIWRFAHFYVRSCWSWKELWRMWSGKAPTGLVICIFAQHCVSW